MHYIYVLYSPLLNKFYTGETHDIPSRLEKHNSDYYDNKWTAKGKPWELFFFLECKSKKQAILIERHIKKMKSKKYIANLKKYPEIGEKLLLRYSTNG